MPYNKQEIEQLIAIDIGYYSEDEIIKYNKTLESKLLEIKHIRKPIKDKIIDLQSQINEYDRELLTVTDENKLERIDRALKKTEEELNKFVEIDEQIKESKTLIEEKQVSIKRQIKPPSIPTTPLSNGLLEKLEEARELVRSKSINDFLSLDNNEVLQYANKRPLSELKKLRLEIHDLINQETDKLVIYAKLYNDLNEELKPLKAQQKSLYESIKHTDESIKTLKQSILNTYKDDKGDKLKELLPLNKDKNANIDKINKTNVIIKNLKSKQKDAGNKLDIADDNKGALLNKSKILLDVMEVKHQKEISSDRASPLSPTTSEISLGSTATNSSVGYTTSSDEGFDSLNKPSISGKSPTKNQSREISNPSNLPPVKTSFGRVRDLHMRIEKSKERKKAKQQEKTSNDSTQNTEPVVTPPKKPGK